MAPMFDAREFRRSLAAFATGVAIVTTTDGTGLRARAWRHFARAKYFAINVLTADQRELSQRFSSTVADKFDGVGAVSGHGGVKRMCLRPGQFPVRVVCHERSRSKRRRATL